MTKEEIQKGIEEMEVYVSVSGIEKELGMPLTTIQKVLKDNRHLPPKWIKPLKKYFKKNRDKDLVEEDKADEKLKEELANDTELTEILEDINKSTPEKKTTFKTGIVLPQSEKVKLNDLNTQSKGKAKDLNEKKKTNYPINTKPVRGKDESAIDFAGRKSDWKKKHLK